MVKRKDGLYQEAVTVNGTRKYFYGKTKAEVKKKLLAYKDEQHNGKPFDAVAWEWWEEHETTLAYNTTKGYKPALNRAVLRFSDTPITNVTPQQISRHIKEFATTHAEKTVNTQLLVYRLIFQYAVEMGYAEYNHARDIGIPQNLPKQHRPAPDNATLKLIKQSGSCTFGLFPLMALYTGLRKGELLALEWDDIDLKSRTISVTKSLYHVNNKPYVKPPKTETSNALVPILDALLPILKKRKGTGIVFPNADGNYLTETQYQKLWDTYEAESGVHCTAHQLRHAYATMLFEANVPPEKAQVLLRHAQISTTMDVYTDLREAKQKQIFSEVFDVDISVGN